MVDHRSDESRVCLVDARTNLELNESYVGPMDPRSYQGRDDSHVGLVDPKPIGTTGNGILPSFWMGDGSLPQLYLRGAKARANASFNLAQ